MKNRKNIIILISITIIPITICFMCYLIILLIPDGCQTHTRDYSSPDNKYTLSKQNISCGGVLGNASPYKYHLINNETGSDIVIYSGENNIPIEEPNVHWENDKVIIFYYKYSTQEIEYKNKFEDMEILMYPINNKIIQEEISENGQWSTGCLTSNKLYFN